MSGYRFITGNEEIVMNNHPEMTYADEFDFPGISDPEAPEPIEHWELSDFDDLLTRDLAA